MKHVRSPAISIIIRCFNEEKHIGRLLSGIQEQTRDDVEVIIVDSGSTDATVAIASHYPVKLISIQPEDFSFGYSLNQGCAAASGEFLVFASAHVYPMYADWLEQLLKPFDNPEIVLTYGKQRGNELTKYSEHQIFAKWFPVQSNFTQTHPFCNNANAAVRRKLWTQFSYDETLSGLEDLDWAKRIIAAGYTLAYAADAEVVHVHEETPFKIYNRYRREAIALKKIFPEQAFSFWDFMHLTLSNIGSDYYHAWRDKMLTWNLMDISRFRLMQFWGTYQGFKQSGQLSADLKQTFYYPRSLKYPVPEAETQRQPIDYAKIQYPHEQVY